jgi:hypothetical protein
VGPPPVFSQVLILKVVKVVCFDTLLQVLILKTLTLKKNCENATGETPFWRKAFQGRKQKRQQGCWRYGIRDAVLSNS